MANTLHAMPTIQGRYVHQEYPKQLNKPGLPTLTVNSEDEEIAAVDRGYSEEPPVVSVPPQQSIPITTQAALTQAYDTLQRQHAETIKDFNQKWNELKFKHDELETNKRAMFNEKYDAQRRTKEAEEKAERLSREVEKLKAAMADKAVQVPATTIAAGAAMTGEQQMQAATTQQIVPPIQIKK